MVSRSKAFEALRRLLRVKVGGSDTMPEMFYFGEDSHEDAKLYTDRVVAIVSCTIVEQGLQKAIATHFKVTDDPEFDELFADNAPLQTFAAKIRLAYALGMFGTKTKQDLNCMRHIRNTFAHSSKHIDFRTPEVSAACDQLRIPSLEVLTRFNKTPTARDKYIWFGKITFMYFFGYPRPRDFKGYEGFAL